MSENPILVDNNALVDLFLGEAPFLIAAEALRLKFPDWVAPPLIRYEFGNVLRTYVRLKGVAEEKAERILSKGLSILTFCEEPEEDVILREAHASGLTFYDASYVACARLHGLRLYTRDKGILQNCPNVSAKISDA
jgi:predicted nucleic acid-binding protein